eukprot:GILI01020336.1.p1 GENE.GILI01020336.1~~GILI01020336.1.p1  ORF type:complete len:495 (-),score=38.84 GILI01020336.1:52-1536(-)
MIYTEVLPFVWLGLITTLSTLLVWIGAYPNAASLYLPAFMVTFGTFLFSQWWLWPPFVYIAAKISHQLAKGRNCIALQAKTDLTGKVAIVTGANSGIGYYTALQLAEMGATVVLACRTEEKAAQTAKQILEEIVKRRGGKRVGGGITNVEPIETPVDKPTEGGSRPTTPQQIGTKVPLKIVSQYGKEVKLRTDLTIEMDDFVSVRRFASRFLATGLPLHLLVNNAGMMVTGLQFSKYNPELELHTAVNFLGPHLLTELLWEKLCQTTLELSTDFNSTMGRSRIVFVSSEAHQFPLFEKTFKWAGGDKNNGQLLEAITNANKGGKDSAFGFIIKPTVSATMAGFVRYGVSKLCNIYSAHYFLNKAAAQSVMSPQSKPVVVTLHPGLIASNFANSIIPFFQRLTFITLAFQKTVFEGSQTTVFACVAADSEVAPLKVSENPHWKTVESPTETEDWQFVTRYLCECSDYSRSELGPVGWSIQDAKSVTSWANHILKV